MTQHDAWTTGPAADDWFARNRHKFGAGPVAPSMTLYAKYVQRGSRVLEIGCSNGYHLDQLQRMVLCEGTGIDPSREAIADGTMRFPNLRLLVGTAEDLSGFPDASFHVVWFGFCLYLIDRALVQTVVKEADRVLCPGGKVLITDFDPIQPHRRAYAHAEGVWSYKMHYPSLWLANPAYALVEKSAYSHDTPTFTCDPNERIAGWVLAKQGESVAWPLVEP